MSCNIVHMSWRNDIEFLVAADAASVGLLSHRKSLLRPDSAPTLVELKDVTPKFFHPRDIISSATLRNTAVYL